MHHAYYIEGSLAEFEPLQFGAFTLREKFEKFGIDEAREVVQRAALKNYTETIFLLEVSSITGEAQQALLKLFEEPQEGTTFVLILPHGLLLPTLRSRMLPYPDTKAVVPSDREAKKFLSSPAKERSASVTALLKDDEGQRERVRSFLTALEGSLHASLGKAKDKKRVLEGLEDIGKVRMYVGDRSPSLKMLLEHLALSLPTL